MGTLLEEALGLRQGTVLEFVHDNALPDAWLTKGRQYVMQADAKPYYKRTFLIDDNFVPERPGDKPVNAALPVRDDKGNLTYPMHLGFRVVEPSASHQQL